MATMRKVNTRKLCTLLRIVLRFVETTPVGPARTRALVTLHDIINGYEAEREV